MFNLTSRALRAAATIILVATAACDSTTITEPPVVEVVEPAIETPENMREIGVRFCTSPSKEVVTLYSNDKSNPKRFYTASWASGGKTYVILAPGWTAGISGQISTLHWTEPRGGFSVLRNRTPIPGVEVTLNCDGIAVEMVETVVSTGTLGQDVIVKGDGDADGAEIWLQAPSRTWLKFYTPVGYGNLP